MVMDEYAHLENFFTSLRDADFWNAFISDIRKCREKSEDDGWLNGKPFDEASYHERTEFDLYRTFAHNQFASVFQHRLLSGFTVPPITADELATLARQQLAGAATLDEFKVAIQRFIAHVGEATYYSSDDINICHDKLEIAGLWIRDGREELMKQLDSCSPIWHSQHGFWLALDPMDSVFAPITVSIWGKLSDGAMSAVSGSMKRIVPSVARTLHLVHSDPSTSDDFSDIPYEVDECQVARDVGLKEKGLFGTLLSYYFLPRTKKTSTFEQRVRNSVHLLVEADSQQNTAIAISLCCSAIEALVCDKTEGIVDELSRHVAALLEPISLNRLSAMGGVKDLYTLRSKALHGDALTEDDSARWKARSLAAATLKAAIEWHNHVTRMGAQPSRADFISELQTAATGQQMVGIPSELSKFLPRRERSPD
jgi:hypothetical protein